MEGSPYVLIFLISQFSEESKCLKTVIVCGKYVRKIDKLHTHLPVLYGNMEKHALCVRVSATLVRRPTLMMMAWHATERKSC